MITIVAFVAVHVFTFTVGKVIAPSHFWIFRFVLSGNQCCTFYVSSAIEIWKNFLRTITIKLTVPQKSVPFDERWARFRPVTKIPPRSCVMRHLTTLVRAGSRALLKRQSIFRRAAYFSLQFSLRILAIYIYSFTAKHYWDYLDQEQRHEYRMDWIDA